MQQLAFSAWFANALLVHSLRGSSSVSVYASTSCPSLVAADRANVDTQLEELRQNDCLREAQLLSLQSTVRLLTEQLAAEKQISADLNAKLNRPPPITLSRPVRPTKASAHSPPATARPAPKATTPPRNTRAKTPPVKGKPSNCATAGTRSRSGSQNARVRSPGGSRRLDPAVLGDKLVGRVLLRACEQDKTLRRFTTVLSCVCIRFCSAVKGC